MLAKAGWFNGNPSTIDAAPVDVVIYSYHYEMFSRKYDAACIELNKVDK